MDTITMDKIDIFFKAYKHQQYKKGEILIRADDDPVGVFYLKEGLVKQYAISKKGDELVVNIFKPESFFPMSWAINQAQNKYFFEALTDLDVWRAPKEEVLTFLKSNPDVLLDLLSRLYTGLDGVLTRMTYLMAGDAYVRLIAELLIYAQRFAKTQKMIAITISEKELAAQAGMTRETVSREMKTLKDKGFIVANRNKLYISDLQKLELELIDGV